MSASVGWAIEAPAKVNLLLRVGRKRPDGYHEIETLFQALELADTVVVRAGGAPPDRDPARGETRCSGRRPGRGSPAVTLHVEGPDLGPVRENLAVRAAEAFAGTFDLGGPVHIRLVKRIPAGAGLGGGSSDAGAVLRLLAGLVERAGGAVDDAELRRIATRLGSDVPFFLQPSPFARGRGRGELLTALAPLPARPVVVALPPVHVATAWAYRALGDARARTAAAPAVTDVTAGSPPEGGSSPGSGSWEEVIAGMANDFEAVVPAAHPEVGASLAGLREAGARAVLLSGSGGASFGLFDEDASATEAAAGLTERLGWPFVATRTRSGVPEPRRVSWPARPGGGPEVGSEVGPEE